MRKKHAGIIMTTILAASLFAGCGSKASDKKEEVTITVFAAKSLNQVMEELIAEFQKTHENVNVQGSYDSSGTLMVQIEEGAACDVFFSAAVKQMNQLDETDGLVVEGTRHNVVNNQVCVVTYKGSNTKVTGLNDIKNAGSIALVSKISTTDISEALGGVEINECANVGAVTSAVAEGSNEVGTVYYSDTYGLEDRLEILEKIPYDLTGDVIYPVAQIQNSEADEAEVATAKEFVDFLITDEAKEIFQKYYFDTDVED